MAARLCLVVDAEIIQSNTGKQFYANQAERQKES